MRSLAIVAKRPAPGQTKTRLCPPLSGEDAAALYACFLADTLEIMRQAPAARRTIAYLPTDAGDYFRQLAPDMALVQQQGADLGERLDNLLTAAFDDGATQAVVMDSDSPTLPPSYVAQAFAALETAAEVVLGPCLDGGYYLIGMKQPHPRLLREVTMSTPNVLQETLALAERLGVRVALLPPWYDVDTIAELRALQAELAQVPPTVAVQTRVFLAGRTWQ